MWKLDGNIAHIARNRITSNMQVHSIVLVERLNTKLLQVWLLWDTVIVKHHRLSLPWLTMYASANKSLTDGRQPSQVECREDRITLGSIEVQHWAQLGSSGMSVQFGTEVVCKWPRPCSRSNNFVATVSSFGFYWLRQLRRYLDTDSIKTFVHAFVMSRVNYCNAVFAGLPRSWCITDKPQCGSRHWHTQVQPRLVTLAAREIAFPSPGSTSQNASTTNWESQCIAVCSTRLLRTWSTAVRQSQTFPADVIYGQPLDITWLYHVTDSALSVVGPSLSLVRRSGTRYRTVSVTRRSPATASNNCCWRRTYFVVTTQHTLRSRDASWLCTIRNQSLILTLTWT